MHAAVRAWLPEDVAVTAVAEAGPGFDARFSALSRRYVYRLCDDAAGWDPLRRTDVLRVPLLYRARAAAAGGVAIAAGAPVSSVDVAAVLARDACIALAAPDCAVPEGAGDPGRPRFAFTWRVRGRARCTRSTS